MQFNIEIINVQATTKPTKSGSYVQLDVAYKRMDTGKIEGKKIMSFANKDAYGVLSKATNGNQFTITSEKNEQTTYWDWVKVEALTGDHQGTTEAPQSKGFASPKSTYETPEERAARQVLIVRQSSLSAAVATLKTDKKELDPDLVMALAGRYNGWVFQKEDKMPDFSDMEDDVPM